MPTARSRRSEETVPPLTLGIAGSGELAKDAAWALLDDFIGEAKVDMVYLPVSDDDTTDEIIHIHRWCVDHDIPYTTVSNDAAGKDRGLKKLIDGAEADYEISESGATQDIVDLLSDGDVADGRLLMFFNGEDEADLEAFEYAAANDVRAFDFLDGLDEITHEEDDGTAPAAPEPTPEPADELAPRRGRRGSKAADPEPAAEKPSGGDYTTVEKRELTRLGKLNLVELKKKAKALGDPSITTESMRGMDKEQVADLIVVTKRNQAASGESDGAGSEEPADEAQTAARPRRGRAAEPAEEPQEPSDSDDGSEDPKEAVFARLRGSREQAERIARGMSAVAKAELDLADDADDIEIAAGMLAAALMAFAEFLIVEVRKPKSAGRPRADGTEAQPKPPADPDAPKRGRGRPRKAVD